MAKLPPRMAKKYRVYYYVRRIDGKKKWIRLSDDYQEALFKYAELEGNKSNNGLISGAITRYRGEILSTKSDKAKADEGYQLNILNDVYGHMQLDDLETMHLMQYLTEKEAKVAANRDIKLLSKVFKKARQWGLTKNNPFKDVDYNPEKSRDRLITDEEFIRLQEAASPTLRAIIQIAYLTGMRRGDILGLKRSDITEHGIFNQQGKTSKKLLATMTPDLKMAINIAKSAQKASHIQYLFLNNKNEPITETGFNSAWRRLREKTGILDIHFHDLRGLAATHAKRKGGLEYAKDLLGHESIEMTEKYIKSKEIEVVKPVQ